MLHVMWLTLTRPIIAHKWNVICMLDGRMDKTSASSFLCYVDVKFVGWSKGFVIANALKCRLSSLETFHICLWGSVSWPTSRMKIEIQ
mgnify:CR=1 FL=1